MLTSASLGSIHKINSCLCLTLQLSEIGALLLLKFTKAVAVMCIEPSAEVALGCRPHVHFAPLCIACLRLKPHTLLFSSLH